MLTEFGGYAYLPLGHSESEKLFGYRKYKDKKDLMEAIITLYEDEILPAIPKGLAGCIYTQVSDVETECNGLFSADREVIKVDVMRMKKMNDRLMRKLK